MSTQPYFEAVARQMPLGPLRAADFEGRDLPFPPSSPY